MKIPLEGLHIKYYVQNYLLLDINRLKTYRSNHIGLTDKNGSGRTTLLHILYKKIVPEEGIIEQFSRCKLIPQLKPIESAKNGGKVTRNYIRQVLGENPELLLTDEPTTNSDNNYIEKLEQDLRN